MTNSEDARAGLAEIAKRRSQVVDGASSGRHRGWDATGMLALVAGFAALDLPAPSALQLGLFLVAVVAALACFTRAGRRGRVVMHRSQLNGRFWVVVGGVALAVGALGLGATWLVDRIDIPLRNTLVGVLLVGLIAASQPLHRVLLRRPTA